MAVKAVGRVANVASEDTRRGGRRDVRVADWNEEFFDEQAEGGKTADGSGKVPIVAFNVI